MTVGIDFKGKTSSAVARLPLLGIVDGVFSGILGVASSIVAPVSVSSVEMEDWEVSRSLWTKKPSKISSKSEVLVPASAIFTFPRPSCLNLAALPSKWAASSNKVRP